MLRITVELVPGGNEQAKETIGTLTIVNDETGTEEVGSYVATVRDAASGIGRSTGFSYRRDRPHWLLVAEAFRQLRYAEEWADGKWTRDCTLFGCVMLDAFSRKSVG